MLVSHDDCAVADRAAMALGTESAALLAKLELGVALLLRQGRAHVDFCILRVAAEVTRSGEHGTLHGAGSEDDLEETRPITARLAHAVRGDDADLGSRLLLGWLRRVPGRRRRRLAQVD